MKPFLSLLAVLCLSASAFAERIKVVATTPDLADLVRVVGGDRVRVECLSSGVQDPHFVEAKPSLILKLRDADLYVQTGLDLEVGWAPLLLQGARNPRLSNGAPGFLDASTFIAPKEVPQNLTRAEGDVHPGGNPHYMADPVNFVPVARGIETRLTLLDPAGKDVYRANADGFERRIREKIAEWASRMTPARGAAFVSYHRNVVYFADRFGLLSAGEIEPKPGIPPSPRHTAELIARMKERGVPLILTMPHFEARTPSALAKATGARVATLALSPGAVPEATDLVATVDYNVSAVLKALNP